MSDEATGLVKLRDECRNEAFTGQTLIHWQDGVPRKYEKTEHGSLNKGDIPRLQRTGTDG